MRAEEYKEIQGRSSACSQYAPYLVSAGNLICFPLGISQKSISKSPLLDCNTVLSCAQSEG